MTTGRTSAASGRAARSARRRVARNVPALAPLRASHLPPAPPPPSVRPERPRASRAHRLRHRPRLRPTGPSPSSRAVRHRPLARRPARSRLLHRKGRRVRLRPHRASRSVRSRGRSRPRLRQPGRARRRPSPMHREHPLVTVSAAPRLPRRLPASRPRPLPRHPLDPGPDRLLQAAAASPPLHRQPVGRPARCRSRVRPRPSRLRRSSNLA